MSVKIRISYEHPHELEAVCKALKPLVDKVRVKVDKEPYKTAYLWVRDIPKNKN